MPFCYGNLNRSKQHIPYLFACYLPTEGTWAANDSAVHKVYKMWFNLFSILFFLQNWGFESRALFKSSNALTIVQHP